MADNNNLPGVEELSEEAGKRMTKEERAAAAAEEARQYAETYRLKLLAEKARAEKAKARAAAKKKAEKKPAKVEEPAPEAEEPKEERSSRTDELIAAIRKEQEAEEARRTEETERAAQIVAEKEENARREAEERELAAKIAEARREAEAKRLAEEKAKAEAEAAEPIDMIINVSEDDDDSMNVKIDEQLRSDDGVINIDSVSYPPEAFESLVEARNEVLRLADAQRRAYEADMDRLKAQHMKSRMDAVARVAAEHSEEYKRLEAEEERYLDELDALSAKRDEAARRYEAKKQELERIIGEYDARRAEVEGADGAIRDIARGVSRVANATIPGVISIPVSAPAPAPAPTPLRSEDKESAELARILAEATLEKERAIAEARLEAERRAKLEAQLAAVEAESDLRVAKAAKNAASAAPAPVAVPVPVVAPAAPKANAATDILPKEEKGDAPAAAPVAPAPAAAPAPVAEAEPEKEPKTPGHVVRPGDIDKAKDKAALDLANAPLNEALAESQADDERVKELTQGRIPAYLDESESELERINDKYQSLTATPAATQAEAVVLTVERLGLVREMIERLADDLKLCVEAGSSDGLVARPKNSLESAAFTYNKLVNEYRFLTGHSLTYADVGMADAIVRGETPEMLPVIKASRASVKDGKEESVPVTLDDVKNTNLKVDTVVDGVRQTDSAPMMPAAPAAPAAPEAPAAAAAGAGVALYAIAVPKKEVPSFLKNQKKTEKKLAKRIDALEKVKPTSTEESLVLVLERLSAQREIIENLSKDLKLCALTKGKFKRRIPSLKRQLRGAIKDYNKIAKEYEKITGDKLTEADNSIPEKIVNGEKYRAIPVLNYRKQLPDGTVLVGSKGDITKGEAYALLGAKRRRKLEKSGIIPAAGTAAIYGLTEAQKKEKMAEDKKALAKKAEALSSAAAIDEAKAKALEKQAKLTSKRRAARRVELLTEADSLYTKSMEEERLAKKYASDEKELKNLSSYEDYLRRTEAEKLYASELDDKLTRDAVEAYEKKLEAKSTAAKGTGAAALAGLTARQVDERRKSEREALTKESESLNVSALEDAERAKEMRALAKDATKKEKRELKAEAEKLTESSKAKKQLSKEKLAEAKSLKNRKAYENYLDRCALAEAARAEDTAKDVAAATAAVAPKKLSKKERAALVKEKRAELLEEARAYEDAAASAKLEAASELKAAKESRSRAERNAHKQKAEMLEAESRAKREAAKATKREAEKLKSFKAYEEQIEREELRRAVTDAQDAKRDATAAAVAVAAKRSLPKSTRNEVRKAEREALLKEAKILEDEAKLAAYEIETERKLAKRARTAAARAEHIEKAQTLAESASEKTELAEEKRRDAKSIGNLEGYDNYLAEQSAKLPEPTKEELAESAYSAYLANRAAKAHSKEERREIAEKLRNEKKERADELLREAEEAKVLKEQLLERSKSASVTKSERTELKSEAERQEAIEKRKNELAREESRAAEKASVDELYAEAIKKPFAKSDKKDENAISEYEEAMAREEMLRDLHSEEVVGAALAVSGAMTALQQTQPKKQLTKAEKRAKVEAAREELAVKRFEAEEKASEYLEASKDKSLKKKERKESRRIASEYADAVKELKREEKKLSTKKGQKEFIKAEEAKTATRYERIKEKVDASLAGDESAVSYYDAALGRKLENKELMALARGEAAAAKSAAKVGKSLTKAEKRAKIEAARDELATKRYETAEKAKAEKIASKDKSLKKSERQASRERAEAYEEALKDIKREEKKLATKKGQKEFIKAEEARAAEFGKKDYAALDRYDSAVGKKAQHNELMSFGSEKAPRKAEKPLTKAEKRAKVEAARDELATKRYETAEKAKAKKIASKDKSLKKSERQASRERAEAYEEALKDIKREEKKLATKKGQKEYLEKKAQRPKTTAKSSYNKDAYLDDASVIKHDRAATAIDAKQRSYNAGRALDGRYGSQMSMYKKSMSHDADLFD